MIEEPFSWESAPQNSSPWEEAARMEYEGNGVGAVRYNMRDMADLIHED